MSGAMSAQSGLALQPLRHEVPTQRKPGKQPGAPSGRHSTHRDDAGSQRPGAGQSASDVHPRHTPESTSQVPASGAHDGCCAEQPARHTVPAHSDPSGQSAAPRHWTHFAVAGSHRPVGATHGGHSAASTAAAEASIAPATTKSGLSAMHPQHSAAAINAPVRFAIQ
jgi:hypothetical protein